METSAPATQSEKRGPRARTAKTILISLVVLGVVWLVGYPVIQILNPGWLSENISPKPSDSIAERSVSNQPTVSAAASKPATEPTDGAHSDPDPVDPSRHQLATEDEVPELAISGAVLDDRGIPLPQISVSARRVSGAAQVPDSTPSLTEETSQLTDELGSFTFEDIEQGEYELVVAETAMYRSARLHVRAGASNAELMLQRIRSVRVFGQVSAVTGEPLAEVNIRLLGTSTRAQSDPTGQYEILVEPLKARQAPVLDFELSGFEDARQRVEAMVAAELDETRLDVQMEADSSGPKVTLSGQVYGPRNEPVDSARIQLSSPHSRSFDKAFSDESGEFVFSSIDASDDYRLTVDPPDEYASFKSDVFPVGPDGYHYPIMLEPAAYADLSGTVTDLDGAQLGNFTLWLHVLGDAGSPPVQLHTDAAGKFQVVKIPVGAIRFDSQSQPWLQVSGMVLEPGESRFVTLPVDWGRDWLFGRVVDDRGEPVPGAQITLKWMQDYPGLNSESQRRAMSDLEGYFTVSNLGAPGYTLSVQAPGFQSTRFQHQIDQANDQLQVTLPRLVSVAQSDAGGG